MTMTILQLQVLNIGDYFFIIAANLFVCIVISLFSLINDVRMTTFTHQQLTRKTSTPEV